MTASPDDPALDNPYEHIKAEFIGENNRAFAKMNFLNAVIVISTTPGLDVYQWKRSKDVQYYIHLSHAATEVTLYRMFGIDYYDAVMLSGEYQAYDIRNLEEMLIRLQSEQIDKAAEYTVLLAPSWGKSAISPKYGGKIIEGK